MNLYFDTAYVAKCYINEPDSEAVRKLVQTSSGMYTSIWSVAEMGCVFQRQIREFKMPKSEAALARDFFLRISKTAYGPFYRYPNGFFFVWNC